MAPKDSTPGLLSKMAKFVRNPTKDWTELDKPEPEPEPEQESGYSKQSLKAMIERRRQNDFVRRREFDHLRKLRRNGPVASQDAAGRPSFFQSSNPSTPGERAMTLKKIDEIEAQMSRQWWRAKQTDVTPVGSAYPESGDSEPTAADSLAPTVGPGPERGAHAMKHAAAARADLDRGDEPTDYQPTEVGLPPSLAASEGTAGAPPPRIQGAANKPVDAGISGFSASKLFSVELGDNLADPDMEEAAIRFANGDDAGAEAGLLAALRAERISPEAASGWAAALFDLYRSTGQQDSFDSVAIDYAQRFGQSAPAWFSTPDLLGQAQAAPDARAVAAPTPNNDSAWNCPPELDFLALQAFRTHLWGATEPWHLNWRALESITPDAGKSLGELFEQWCSQPVKLHFDGAEVLERVLRMHTPSGDKEVDSFWWRLRLDALRILRLQDEFELAALDFCVTYEVSPPPWQDGVCECTYERVDASGRRTAGEGWSADTILDTPTDMSLAATLPMGLEASTASVVELTGEVLGDAAEALDKLQAGLKDANRLVISCARLIRVDFSAAGSILNWVAVREAEGCHVQFRDVPRLVATFFNVIGINEHAQVLLRNS